jgi:hypothetical protein
MKGRVTGLTSDVIMLYANDGVGFQIIYNFCKNFPSDAAVVFNLAAFRYYGWGRPWRPIIVFDGL